jgi:hypothetical protein
MTALLKWLLNKSNKNLRLAIVDSWFYVVSVHDFPVSHASWFIGESPKPYISL